MEDTRYLHNLISAEIGSELALLCEPTILPYLVETDMKNYGKLFKYAEIYDLNKCKTYFCAIAYYDEASNKWVNADVEFQQIPDDIKRAIIRRNTLTDYGHDK